MTEEPTDGGAERRAPDDRGHLHRARDLAIALRSVLDEECAAIAVAEPDGLTALSVRKRRLLASLEALQPELGDLLTRLPEADRERRELLDTLETCRLRNAENGVATGTAVHHVRGALALLRETQVLDDLTLYDERGELCVRRERRRLGSA